MALLIFTIRCYGFGSRTKRGLELSNFCPGLSAKWFPKKYWLTFVDIDWIEISNNVFTFAWEQLLKIFPHLIWCLEIQLFLFAKGRDIKRIFNVQLVRVATSFLPWKKRIDFFRGWQRCFERVGCFWILFKISITKFLILLCLMNINLIVHSLVPRHL